MAVWTKRDEVFDWINLVRLTNFTHWHDMVNVDIASTKLTEAFTKIKSTYAADYTMVLNTFLTSITIPLVTIH